MKYSYIVILIFSILGMFLTDKKYRLVFFKNHRAAVRSIAIVMGLLILVDIIGINWLIFSTNSAYVVGLYIGSEGLPIEEFLFLFLLCYFILDINQLIARRLANAKI
ncbi:MAG: lycopene cyclase domain-containing protein [bacterium]